MKRWIVMLMIAAFGFVPMCRVFAMQPSIMMPDEPCASASVALEHHHETGTSIHSPIPTLSCCEQRSDSTDLTQTLSTFQIQHPVIHEKTFTGPIKCIHSRATELHTNAEHPPDDFERYSLAKRE